MKVVTLSLTLTIILASLGFAQMSPGAEPASALTLQALEQMALENNPTLNQAAARIRSAEGRHLQSGLYPNPTVGYQGEQIRGGAQRGGEQGFFVGQNIVLGGKLGLDRNVQAQEKRLANAQADEQKLRVLTNVRLFYYRALAAQEMVELRHQLQQLAADAMQTSHQLANVGQADQPDVLQSELESEQAALAAAAAEQNQLRVWQGLAATVGKPELPISRLSGTLEDIPEGSPEQWLQGILKESPSLKIAQLEVDKADASLARARRESIPDLQLRAGMQQNRELDATTGRPIGLQGFADVGVQIPLFNRNQGNVAAASADAERARGEVQRVQLALREQASPLLADYSTSRLAVERYREHMLPRARKAYELYLKSYQQMGAAYPQVLIAQRTLFQLQSDYIIALEGLWTNAVALKGFMLTEGLGTRPAAGMGMSSAMTIP